MKKTWNAINDIIGKGKRQSSQCKFKDESGNTFTNPQDISNQFNDFFVNVGPELASIQRETLLQCRGAENYLCQHLQPRLQRISV